MNSNLSLKLSIKGVQCAALSSSCLFRGISRKSLQRSNPTKPSQQFVKERKSLPLCSEISCSTALLFPPFRSKEPVNKIPEELSSCTFAGKDVVQSVRHRIFPGFCFLPAMLIEAFGQIDGLVRWSGRGYWSRTLILDWCRSSGSSGIGRPTTRVVALLPVARVQ